MGLVAHGPIHIHTEPDQPTLSDYCGSACCYVSRLFFLQPAAERTCGPRRAGGRRQGVSVQLAGGGKSA